MTMNLDNLTSTFDLRLWLLGSVANGNYDCSINRFVSTAAGSIDTAKTSAGSSAYNYQGTSYLVLPDKGSDALNPQKLTISVWIRAPTYAAPMFLFEKTNISTVVNTEYSLFLYPNVFYFRTIGTSTLDYNPTLGNLVANKWNHIAATWDQSVKRVYVNSKEVGAGGLCSGNHLVDPMGYSWIGTYGGGVGYPYNGNMQSMMIFGKNLNQDQITALYEATFIE